MKDQWWVLVFNVWLNSGARITAKSCIAKVDDMGQVTAEQELLNAQGVLKNQIDSALKSATNRFVIVTPDLNINVDQLAAHEVILKTDFVARREAVAG